MFKHSDTKFHTAEVGDNVHIRIPFGHKGHGDPRSVLEVVMNVEGTFYRLRTHGVLKQLDFKTEFFMTYEKPFVLDSVGTFDVIEQSAPYIAANLEITDCCVIRNVIHVHLVTSD